MFLQKIDRKNPKPMFSRILFYHVSRRFSAKNTWHRKHILKPGTFLASDPSTHHGGPRFFFLPAPCPGLSREEAPLGAPLHAFIPWDVKWPRPKPHSRRKLSKRSAVRRFARSFSSSQERYDEFKVCNATNNERGSESDDAGH
jgi:hypothetical protein